ncbi:DUF4974 domain-containing protein [Sphingobacterium olei]|uniref:DUF4974 domain-containing protein n=1 Tax=Sphingobacterium olei TaxID=2571155 RepID=A0A4U0P2N8_9SPHI|nr:FecR domain-containing protein [Sphingobacterium olei]TJZ61515.1 DUF4974 domain-containing protein [Sphingobacterium olei]
MNKRLKYLYDRYVADTATATEREEFESALLNMNHDADLKVLLEEAFDAYPRDTLPTAEADAIYTHILNRPQPLIKRRQTIWWLAAAMVLILSGLVVALLRYQNAETTEAVNVAHTERIETHDRREYVILPDSSVVILNEGSALSYAKDFGHADRIVILEGEAFFDVAKKKNKPFIVKTARAQTRVLGTKFNVKANNKTSIEVTVTEGKVQLEADGKVLGVVHAKQQITFDATNATYNKKSVVLTPVVAWHAGDLFFNDTTPEQAFRSLENKYKVRVHYPEQLIGYKRLSATFLAHEPLSEVMDAIAAFYNVEYRLEGEDIYLQPR